MKIKTCDLQGAALDWAVAKCEGYNVGVYTAEDVIRQQLEGETDPERIAWIKDVFSDFEPIPCLVSEDGYKSEYSSKLAIRGISGKIQFSTDWSQGGPIIDREKIIFPDWFEGRGFHAAYARAKLDHLGKYNSYFGHDGETMLIAAMRCYVASKLGFEIEVPKELLK